MTLRMLDTLRVLTLLFKHLSKTTYGVAPYRLPQYQSIGGQTPLGTCFLPAFCRLTAIAILYAQSMSTWKHLHQPRAAMVLLRVTLSVLLLFHGWVKITQGVGSIEALLTQAGLPAFLAYGVFIGEVIAPLLVLVGLYVVPAAWIIAINMVVAIALVHTSHFFQLSKSGGWSLELQAFFLVSAIVVALGHSRKP